MSVEITYFMFILHLNQQIRFSTKTNLCNVAFYICIGWVTALPDNDNLYSTTTTMVVKDNGLIKKCYITTNTFNVR